MKRMALPEARPVTSLFRWIPQEEGCQGVLGTEQWVPMVTVNTDPSSLNRL